MIKLSPLEDFVKKYLKGIKKSGNLRDMLPFVNKAIALIRIKLGEDCCSNPATTYNYTRKENDFTRTVRYLLKKMYGPGTDKILNRVLRILEVFAGACCPLEIIVNWVDITSGNSQISFIGQSGQGTFTSEGDVSTYTFMLPPGQYVVSVTVPADFDAGELTVADATNTLLTIPDTSAGPITEDSSPVDLNDPYTVTFTPAPEPPIE